MLLSELNKLSPDTANVHGIVVDKYSPQVLAHIKNIGIILKADAEQSFDEDTLDVIIAYHNQGKQVLIEVPHDVGIGSEVVMSVASAIGINVSLLFPTDTFDAEQTGKYLESVSSYFDYWMGVKNNTIQVTPIIDYYSYIIEDHLGKEHHSMTEDDYIQEKYVDNINPVFLENVKTLIKNKVYDHFGSKAEFERFAFHTLGLALVATQ